MSQRNYSRSDEKDKTYSDFGFGEARYPIEVKPELFHIDGTKATQSLPKLTSPPNPPSIDEVWLNTDEFAKLAKHKDSRNARIALANSVNSQKPWRNHSLVVRTVAGKRGGMSYQVRLDSLPEELIERWRLKKADQNDPQTGSKPPSDSSLRIISPLNDPQNPKNDPQTALLVDNTPHLDKPDPQKNLIINQAVEDEDRQSNIEGPIGDPIGDLDLTLLSTNTLAPKWITPLQLSQLANLTEGSNTISERVAQITLVNIYNSKGVKPWRGSQLLVRQVQGGRGGNAGVAYEVHIDSLPQELKTEYYQRFNTVKPVTTKPREPFTWDDAQKASPKFCDLRKASQSEKTRKARNSFRLEVCSEIESTTQKGTTERKNKIASMAKIHSISEKAIYKWLLNPNNAIETVRSDAGKRKTQITRCWEDAFAEILGQATCDKIERDLDFEIRSEFASFDGGAKKLVKHFTIPWLIRRTTEELKAINQEVPLNIDTLCRIPYTRLREDENRKYRLIQLADNDRKGLVKHEPSIRRHRDGILPGMIVVGDVHPVDISIRRDDGTIAYPRAIAWQDIATNRLHITLKLCEKGEGVTQSDIIQSFISMVKAWGPPVILYMDNGREYKLSEMIESITNLSALLKQSMNIHPDVPAYIRSIPYNAQAKPIEGLFSLLEQQYCYRIPGYTGGDRVNKKTQNVGKTPEPFPDKMIDFLDVMDQLLTEYHNQPQQRGFLQGDSPNSRLKKHIEAGWGKWKVDEQALLLSFARTPVIGEGFRKINAGKITLNGLTYFNQKLANDYPQSKVLVKYLPHDPYRIFVITGPEVICANLDVKYAYFDLKRNGAKSKHQRQLSFARSIDQNRQYCDILDYSQDAKRWNQLIEDKPAELTVGNIEMSDEALLMLRALENETTTPALDERPYNDLLEIDADEVEQLLIRNLEDEEQLNLQQQVIKNHDEARKYNIYMSAEEEDEILKRCLASLSSD